MNMRNDPCNWDAQDQQQWQEAIHQSWATNGEAAQQTCFDLWLDTPEGHAWLNAEAERYESPCDYGYYWEKSL